MLGLAAFTFSLSRRHDITSQLLRAPGAPFVVEGESVRNTFTLRVESHRDAPVTLEVVGDDPELAFTVASPLRLDAMGSARIPLVVSAARGASPRAFDVIVVDPAKEASYRVEGRFLAPPR